MPKGFSDHEKDLIRQRLLEQGYKQFSAFGLKKATVEELAAAAGISKGAFYLFFDSKETLFLAVAEETVERRFRQDLLALVDRPGPSPRERLLAVLRQAFALFNTIPLLQFLAGSDYELLLRRVPPEKLREHLAGDQAFFEELIARCRGSGIPVRVSADEISGLLYTLFVAAVHAHDSAGASLPVPRSNGRPFDTLLELVAAYSLGEVELSGESRD